MSQDQDRIKELEKALAPFAAAYLRLRDYGGDPTDDVPLHAVCDDVAFELLDGEEGDRLTVYTLRAAFEVMAPLAGD